MSTPMREHRHALALYQAMGISHRFAAGQLLRLLNTATQVIESARQCGRCKGLGGTPREWITVEDCPMCWGLGFVLRVKSAA